MNKQLLFLRCKKLLLLSCILTGLSVYGQNKSAPVPNNVPAFNVSGQLTTSPVDLGLQNENPAMYEYKKAEQLKAGTLTEEERLISSESFSQVPKSRLEELQLKLSLTQEQNEIRFIEQEINRLNGKSNQENSDETNEVTPNVALSRIQELQLKLASTINESEIALIKAELNVLEKQVLTSKESVPNSRQSNATDKNQNISIQGELIQINGVLYEKNALEDLAKDKGISLQETLTQIANEQ
jgi:hypothetical protein